MQILRGSKEDLKMVKSMIINELLDAALIKTEAVSDYKLSQVLEIPKQRISAMRSGSEKPNSYICAKLAQALGRDPMEIIAMVEAESAKSETQRAFWRSFKFSGMRSSLGLLLCGMWVGFGAALPSGNAEASLSTNSHNVY